MSRKKKQAAPPVDTGGLDLNKFAKVKELHNSVSVENEVLPVAGSSAGPEQSVDNRQVAGSNPAPPTTPEEEFGEVVAPVEDTPNKGVFLHVALVQSFFHMAARKARPDIYVVSNGQRFWTASLTLEPTLAMGIQIGGHEAEAERDDWFPIKGSEKGLIVDESYR